MSALDAELLQIERLAIDSAPIIYFMEEHPRYVALVEKVFRRIDSGHITAVSSALTLTEVLTKPLESGEEGLRDRYLELLLSVENFSIVAIDVAIATRAAELRARYGIRTPDALQVACAVETGCQGFLTNDKKLARITELQVLVLESFVRDT